MRLSKLTLLGYLFFFLITSSSAKIVFFSTRDGADNLYVMDDEGHNVKKITDTQVINTQPRWSPDGTQIAFLKILRQPEKRLYDVFLMDADGRNQQQLTHHPAMDGGYLTWSPDGQHIAFNSWRTGNGNIHTIHIATRNIKQLTHYKPGERLSAREPGWSPDGKRIAYIVGGRFIYLMDTEGGNQELFLDGGTFIREPLWGPDGKSIMYSEWTFGGDKHKEVVSSRAVIVNLQGREVRERILPEGWGISSKSWMGSQKALLAIHTDPRGTDIFLWDFTSDALKNLTNSPGVDWTPDWVEGALEVTPSEKKTALWGEMKTIP